MNRRLRTLKAELRRWWYRRFPQQHPHFDKLPARSGLSRQRGQRVLAIGPLNTAGQGWSWARAVERFNPSVKAEVFAIRRGGFAFDSDYLVEPEISKLEGWGFQQYFRMKRSYTHVLNESFSPMLGNQFKGDIRAELLWLQDAGKKVGVVLHGSEVRNPDRHAQREPLSPFADPEFVNLETLRQRTEKVSALIAGTLIPIFVSTPDLVDDVPKATWLPVVVDMDRFAKGRPLRSERPKVLHLPSSEALKGTALIVPILEDLDAQGIIEFVRPGLISSEEAVKYIKDCDIVADQFTLGIYGVLAVEAMAAGKVVVSHVSQAVRDRVLTWTGLPLPIVEAEVGSLTRVLSELVTDMSQMQSLSEQGMTFAREVHDGRRSARVLEHFLA